VAVLDHQIAVVAQFRLFAASCTRQSRIRIGGRFVRLIGALIRESSLSDYRDHPAAIAASVLWDESF
jgi:hypothetical protein